MVPLLAHVALGTLLSYLEISHTPIQKLDQNLPANIANVMKDFQDSVRLNVLIKNSANSPILTTVTSKNLVPFSMTDADSRQKP